MIPSAFPPRHRRFRRIRFLPPQAFSLDPGQCTRILTGIRARIDDGWVLKIYPRSGLGFKYRLQLNNTVGIIDSDYYGSDNEGHIQIKLTNDSREGKRLEVKEGTGFAQGSSWNMGSPWTTRRRRKETAALAAPPDRDGERI